jgi:undecaprenyl diphosphate synthase
LKDLAKLKATIDPQSIPKHVAIIMDGNGRWARNRMLPRIAGHREGAKRVREIVEAAGQLGIKALTLFTFSDDNWKRSTTEVNALMKLLNQYLVKERDSLDANNVRLEFIGEIGRLPPENQRVLRESRQMLKNNTGLVLVLALSYGARAEITAACRRIAESHKQGLIEAEDITTDLFQAHLQTPNVPELDLLIRTSGELRVSNFLLWQMAYAELVFTPVLWPQFNVEHLYQAILEYQKRDRRFGGAESFPSEIINPEVSGSLCSSSEY